MTQNQTENNNTKTSILKFLMRFPKGMAIERRIRSQISNQITQTCNYNIIMFC